MDDRYDYSLHYRRYHTGSASEVAAQADLYERWIGALVNQHPPDARVLDYGCGFGFLVAFLRRRFRDVTGVDASSEQVEVARSHDLPVELVSVTDFSEWCNSRAASYDVIFLFDVLEHVAVDSQIHFLRQLTGTLRDGGTIYIKVPNANSLLASRWRYIDWTHRSSFTEASLDFVCLNAGLGSIDYFADDSSLKPRLAWVPRPGLGSYYARCLFRSLWKIYLRAELGSQARDVRVGYNLFVRARKT